MNQVMRKKVIKVIMKNRIMMMPKIVEGQKKKNKKK